MGGTGVSETKNLLSLEGLPVTRRPEWTDVQLDEGYRVTIFVLGENILVGRPTGHVSMKAVKGVTALSKKIVDEVIGADRPYIHMQDYTGLTGVSLKARRYFIEDMKGREQIKCIIFCGVSPFFRVAVQLAKRLHGFTYDFHIVRDYPEAVRLAKNLTEAKPSSPPMPAAGVPGVLIGEEGRSSLTGRHVEDVLRYLESINWEKAGAGTRTEVSPDHPFRPVFTAIDLVKKELDDLISDRSMVEEALRRTQSELWGKIADRTAELAAAKEKIRSLEESPADPSGETAPPPRGAPPGSGDSEAS
jgi:hypothetical protein